MRRIALHEYLGQIEGLLDDNRLPEAAAHCHFVLQQYPRHVGAYRLFGRALLEQQLYEDAIDVFERLLSADPEDLISHAGLALAYGESRDLERAIWHMERAFEIDPYNRAVQDELRKLYIARDGDAPSRLALTRAALARLHFKASLHQQAMAEYTRLVTANPDRVDLRLALAETLFWDSGAGEATSLCQEVLETLPYCIKANAIVANALLKEERVDTARMHLRRIQDLTMLDRFHLDPDTTLGRALSISRITLPKSVQVEVLEDAFAFAKGFEDRSAWPDPDSTVIVDGETLPDWLQEMGTPETEPADEPPADGIEAPAETIEWLEEVAPAAIEESGTGQDDLAVALVEGAVETTTDAQQEVESSREATMAASDDTLGELLDGVLPEKAVDTALSPAESADIVGIPDTGGPLDRPAEVTAEEEVTEPRPWDDEQLLALDELRSFIDEDDGRAGASTMAPEWMDEIAERANVADELPQWLHEAVGFEAPIIETDGLSDQHLADEASKAAGAAADGLVATHDELSPSDQSAADFEDDPAAGDPASAEREMPEASAGSALPDWLLEGNDVLEELPGGILSSDREEQSAEASWDDSTMAWLDELSEQLANEDDNAPAGAPE